MRELQGRPTKSVPKNTPGIAGFRDVVLTWGPLLAVSAVIFGLSSQPGFGRPDQIRTLLLAVFGDGNWLAEYQGAIAALDAMSSWLAHLVEYAILALAAWRAVRRQWPAYSHAYLFAFVYAAVFAVSDEVHQHFVPGRHADVRDVLVDLAGAALALTAAKAYQMATSPKISGGG